jgi:hypothetical protein
VFCLSRLLRGELSRKTYVAQTRCGAQPRAPAKAMGLEDSTVIERASMPPQVALSETELVLLDVAGSVYFTLQGPVAVRIWELLAAPQSLAALIQALVEEFDIDQVRCRQQTVSYLQVLESRGLVRHSTPP